jgi:hypothetical protein
MVDETRPRLGMSGDQREVDGSLGQILRVTVPPYARLDPARTHATARDVSRAGAACLTQRVEEAFVATSRFTGFVEEGRKDLVRKGGLEPPRSCDRQPLKLVRLPIPPLSLWREPGALCAPRPATKHPILARRVHTAAAMRPAAETWGQASRWRRHQSRWNTVRKARIIPGARTMRPTSRRWSNSTVRRL